VQGLRLLAVRELNVAHAPQHERRDDGPVLGLATTSGRDTI
jgi:hypothetical protein